MWIQMFTASIGTTGRAFENESVFFPIASLITPYVRSGGMLPLKI